MKAGTLSLSNYSLFCSFLSHGVTEWALTHPFITNPLYKLQKKVICGICFEDKYAHTTSLFHELKILKLYDIHPPKLLCFAYDCTKDQPITYSNNFFTPVHLVHQHLTHQVLCSDIMLIQPNIESGLLNIMEPFCGIIFQCILRTRHLRSFPKKNHIKCLLNLILKDKPTIISAYIILSVSDLATSASF